MIEVNSREEKKQKRRRRTQIILFLNHIYINLSCQRLALAWCERPRPELMMHYSSNQLSVAAIAPPSTAAAAAAKFININSKQWARFPMYVPFSAFVIRVSCFSLTSPTRTSFFAPQQSPIYFEFEENRLIRSRDRGQKKDQEWGKLRKSPPPQYLKS